ncbi:MAG: hypothetical protein KDH19_04320 [Geminicoccaceae bacterium]|nr:hypothetical protein [Geminicoccaceae bacterium]
MTPVFRRDGLLQRHHALARHALPSCRDDNAAGKGNGIAVSGHAGPSACWRA